MICPTCNTPTDSLIERGASWGCEACPCLAMLPTPDGVATCILRDHEGMAGRHVAMVNGREVAFLEGDRFEGGTIARVPAVCPCGDPASEHPTSSCSWDGKSWASLHVVMGGKRKRASNRSAAARTLLMADLGPRTDVVTDFGPPPWLRLVRWGTAGIKVRACLVAYETQTKPRLADVRGMVTLCGERCEFADSTSAKMPDEPICQACAARAGRMVLR